MTREDPPRNTIYTGMLAVSLAAILVGCLVLALELTNDYDWTMEAKGGPPISLPAKSAPTPGPTAAAPAPGEKKFTQSPPERQAPTPAAIPAPVPLPNPVVAVAPPAVKPPVPEIKPTEVSQPVAKPTGIIPSPLKIPGGR